MKKKKEVLVLFSGGIDSTSCLYYYQKLGYKTHGLFVNYGQLAEKQERIAVNKISKLLSIDTIFIDSNIKPISNDGVIQGRNYFLLSQALLTLPFATGIVSLGIHSGTNFPDCDSTFISKNQVIYDMYSDGEILIDCPFIDLQKNDIYDYFLKTNIPINYTYSCENGGDVPCGICSTCKDLKKIQDESEK